MKQCKCLLALSLILAGALAACSSGGGPQLALRHKESGLNSAFRYSDMSYPDYVAHMRRVIADARQDLTPANRERVIDWNSPFLLEPDATKCPPTNGARMGAGVLLIHGLTDSPFEMRDLAAHFQERCYLVYGLLLPGHGTRPGDLLAVREEEWIKATRYGIAALRPRVAKLYVGGFSTGGALAVQAALNNEPVDGLLLFAPALGLRSSTAFVAPAAAGVHPWVDVAPDEDPTKYESFATNAAAQIWRLVFDLKFQRQNRPLKVPLFVVQSADDQTVDPEATIDYFRGVADSRSRILIYGNGGKPEDPRFVPIAGARPAEQILDLAHLSLTVSPDNPHYGRNGDYRNCMHYLDDAEKWRACKAGQGPAGEITKENLGRGVMRRLTYNPDYANMLQQMDAFLARIE
jgi:esterase/lipase